MRKFSKNGILLVAGAMAVCAFAMPATSSAASWGVINSEHTLHSTNLGFTATDPVLGAISSSCADSTFTVDVRSAAALTVTGAAFRNCTGRGPAISDCTLTLVGTAPDWTATGITTSNVQIDNVRIDMTFENKPGSSSCVSLNNQSLVVTGTLTGGTWNAAQHEVVFNNAEGIVYHGPTGNNTPTTWSGTIHDTAQTLTLT
jgi:hypothetical protein